MARYRHADLLAIVRDAAGAVLGSRLLAHLPAVRDDWQLRHHLRFGRNHVLQLGEMLEEDLGIILAPHDLARLLEPGCTLADAASLCVDVLNRQDELLARAAARPVIEAEAQHHG